MLKHTPLPELKEAVLAGHRGGAPMSRSVARKVLAHFKPTPSVQADLRSGRERSGVQAVVDGLSGKQVATRLNLSVETERTYTRRIYKKRQVGGRSELMSRSAKDQL